MSAPNPLIPQGTFQAQAAKGATNVRLAVATIVAIHVVFFGGLLLQGCKRDPNLADASVETNSAPTNALSLPPIDTSSLYYSTGSLPAEASSSVANNTRLGGGSLPPDQNNNAEAMWQSNVAATGALATESGPMKEYTVVSGDSFGRIAQRNKTTVSAIRKANPGVDPLKIRPGQKINLPAPTQATEATTLNNTSGASSASGTSDVYIVKSGDTLTRIAERHKTTVRQLRQANNLATSRLNIGQKLKIPAKTNSDTQPSGTASEPGPQAF
jgi:LysM repeat protein